MSRYMLTHSLLSSWLYAIKENPYEDATTEANSLDDFLRVLRREPTPITEAMQNGIVFENLVTAILQGEDYFGHKWFGAANAVATRLRGSQLQVKAQRTIPGKLGEWLLYGRLDALKAGTIYDIKFSKGYDRGKYIGSTQHPMYFALLPEATTFVYLISNGTEVWSETYRREETPEILPTVYDFAEWLTSAGYLELYKEKWASR